MLAASAAFGRDYPLPPRGAAIQAPATAPLAGSWIGEARAPERTYKILLFHTAGAPMYDGTENYNLQCFILEPRGLEDSYCKSFSLGGDATTLKASMTGEYGDSQKGLFAASSAFGDLELSLGGDGTLSGTWEEAAVSFTRLAPRITRAEAEPVRFEDLQSEWRHFRENGGSWKGWQFSQLRVFLTGTDLPRAGFGVGQIVVDDPHFELYSTTIREDGRLRLEFRLHEGVRSGKKRLTFVGGATAEFDLVIANEAPRIQIGSLSFDYSRWHAERLGLQREVDLALDAVTQLNRRHAEQLQRVAGLQAEVGRLQQAEEAKRGELAAALDRASEVPDELKDVAYRRYEARIARSEARMEQIMERLPLAIPEGKIALVDEHRRLEKLVASDRAAMQQLEIRLGIARRQAAAEQEAAAAEAAHLQAVKDLARGISERNIIANVLAGTLDDYHEAVDRHAKAQQQASHLGQTAPLITLVRAPGFEATVWHPEEDLRHLDVQIASARDAMFYWDAKRRDYRTLLPTRYYAVDSAAAGLINWQHGSIAAQAGVELLFTGGDILIKFREGGVVAALGEAYKKTIENVIWPPTYLDANNLVPEGHDLLDTLEANAPSAEKALTKRLYKSAGTGTVTSVAVKTYVRNQSAARLQELAGRMIRQSWLDGEEEFLRAVRRNFEIGPLLEAQRATLAKAEQKLKSATSLKGAASGAAKSFVSGLVKDYAKHEAKQAIANLFEGDAFQAYNAAQTEYGATATLLLRSSNYYWQAADLFAALTSAKREILREYDPVNAMKVRSDGDIATDSDLLIEFSNRDSDPHHPNPIEMDVFLGGIEAERLSGQRLIYRVPAKDLQRLPEGKQELRAVVTG